MLDLLVHITVQVLNFLQNPEFHSNDNMYKLCKLVDVDDWKKKIVRRKILFIFDVPSASSNCDASLPHEDKAALAPKNV